MRRKICYKKEWKEKYDKKDTHDNFLITLHCYSFKPIAYRGGEGNWGYFNLQKAQKHLAQARRNAKRNENARRQRYAKLLSKGSQFTQTDGFNLNRIIFALKIQGNLLNLLN